MPSTSTNTGGSCTGTGPWPAWPAPPATRTTRRSSSSTTGIPLADVTDPGEIEGVQERLAQLTEDGQFFEHGEVRGINPVTGEPTLMEITSIRTTWGGEPAYQVIGRDISERRAAEAANRYRASLIAHVSDAIIGIDAEGKIESWNEAAEAIYGWSEEEVTRPVDRRRGHRQPHRQRRRARARPRDPPPQGRFRGRGPGLHRPPDRRRHPAVWLGGGVHRADRCPPGRSRASRRRGTLRGGGGLAQRGHRPVRRER